MPAVLTQVRDFLGGLPPRQRITLGAVVAGGLALLVGVSMWAGRPDYALLFGGLPAAEAGRLVEQLREDRTPYQLRDGGTAVYVPREQVYELRMRFAASGLVSDGQTGYELFDRSTLGMTDFMQKVNYKRAIEGELARTIASVQGVQRARVHLVLPERTAFRAQQARASASVVLHLSGGARPDGDRIEGVAALVAGAVEGLDPADVTVLDHRGALLSTPGSQPGGTGLTTVQLGHQRAVEDHLAERGQTMLDRMLGPGRAVVRVAAALDFSRTVTETNRIDPESQTILSEERTDEQGEISQTNALVRNYDLTRSRETQERAAGEVKGITVSVLLDQRRVAAEGEAAEPQARPYTDTQLREIEALVANAVGLDPERGDRITIQQAAFDTSVEAEAIAEAAAARTDERLRLGLRYGLMLAALGLAAWLLRAATARVTTLAAPMPDVGAPGTPSGDGVAVGFGTDTYVSVAPGAHAEAMDDLYASRLSPEAKARLAARREHHDATRTLVAEKPEEAAALIQSWLAEDRLATAR